MPSPNIQNLDMDVTKHCDILLVSGGEVCFGKCCQLTLHTFGNRWDGGNRYMYKYFSCRYYEKFPLFFNSKLKEETSDFKKATDKVFPWLANEISTNIPFCSA